MISKNLENTNMMFSKNYFRLFENMFFMLSILSKTKKHTKLCICYFSYFLFLKTVNSVQN